MAWLLLSIVRLLNIVSSPCRRLMVDVSRLTDVLLSMKHDVTFEPWMNTFLFDLMLRLSAVVFRNTISLRAALSIDRLLPAHDNVHIGVLTWNTLLLFILSSFHSLKACSGNLSEICSVSFLTSMRDNFITSSGREILLPLLSLQVTFNSSSGNRTYRILC